MSAIYGQLNFNRQALSIEDFDQTSDALKIWGPDGFDAVVQTDFVLAQATLIVAPYAIHTQIATTETGNFVIADAIIDNRPELAAKLELDASLLLELSDTALIALAWDKWGRSCVEHAIGDFAFAVIDPAKRSVFLARDHIGARPLYWAKRGNTLLWCTAADILIKHSHWSWPISDEAVTSFQANSGSPLKTTFYDHLQKLEPGHCAYFTPDKMELTRWWNPTTRPNLKLSSPKAYATACRALVDRAVEDRASTAFPIGAHLSGGIDSTGVAVIAARYLATQNRQVCGGYAWSPAFCDDYPDMGSRDERNRIALVGEQENIPVRFGTSDCENLFAFFKRTMETEGIADLADEVPILKNAASDGARIVLSGWGGDEGFSSHGVGYLAHLLLRGNFSAAKTWMHRQTRSLKNINRLSRILWWDAFHLMLPEPLHQLFSRYYDPDYNNSFIRPEVAKAKKKKIVRRQMNISFGSNPNENIKRYAFHGHIGMRMETWAAWAAPYGFQYRYPLTDRRLLEFLMSIPPEALYPNELPRGLALATLADALPKNVTKYDAANEALRAKSRFDSWQIAQDQARSGVFDEDCPWLDMPAFRKAALNPIDQTISANVMRFAELMTALRLWFMWKRQG